MQVVAFDTETGLIRQGKTAPDVVCLTYQVLGQSEASYCSDRSASLREWLSDPNTTLVGHNVSFDLAVVCSTLPDLIPLVFRAYEDDRITDTLLRQKLLDIANGCYRGFFDEASKKFVKYDYSLASLARRLCGVGVKKEGFRMFYECFRDKTPSPEHWADVARCWQTVGARWLEGTPNETLDNLAQCFGDMPQFRKEVTGMISALPGEAYSYPLEDALVTLAVYEAQERAADKRHLSDQFRQARKAWCLHLTSAWGLRTDRGRVEALRAATERAIRDLQTELVKERLIRPNGTRDTKAAAERMKQACLENNVPLAETVGGGVSLDSDACKACGDPVLASYAELTSLNSVLNKDLPLLTRGTKYPIHTRFDLAASGRVTASSPNVQNMRRLPGIREAFSPRPGHVFAQADYSGLELATLAQACLDLVKQSKLADAINSGNDPHAAMACTILDIEYSEGMRLKKEKDEKFINARQTSKVANFGFPGGLGPAKLVLFARKSYGVVLTVAEARALKDQWLKTWPEMQLYFSHVNSLSQQDRHGDKSITITQLRSERIRKCNAPGAYTAACNSYFQGLGVDAVSAAFWLVQKACYVDRNSPLFGSRVVNMIHDEFIVETKTESAPESAEELSRLMLRGASSWIPDVRLEAEPCLMSIWSKNAATLRDDKGRLQAWEPKKQ